MIEALLAQPCEVIAASKVFTVAVVTLFRLSSLAMIALPSAQAPVYIQVATAAFLLGHALETYMTFVALVLLVQEGVHPRERFGSVADAHEGQKWK